METACHHCGTVGLEAAPGFEQFQRVTSDCKAWPPGGRLALCPACGLVQTPVTPAWRAECDRIYRDYTIYHQGGGAEQAVFSAGAGQGSARSAAILEALRRHCRLAESGRWLDVGCGNGAFLRVASASLPAWGFVGTEFDDKYRAAVESIPRVERLHTGPLDALGSRFDVVSLIHVLEHIPGPVAMVESIRGLLNPGGLLVVEVPDCSQNPFMLLVADHCSHFGTAGLGGIVGAGSFEVLHATNEWVSKEVTVVGRRLEMPAPATPSRPSPRQEAARILDGVQALHQVRSLARHAAKEGRFGLFGASIAATWLQAELEGAAEFFVDEDPSRHGRRHMDRPILAPEEVPAGSRIFMALPHAIASRVAGRLRRDGVEYVVA